MHFGAKETIQIGRKTFRRWRPWKFRRNVLNYQTLDDLFKAEILAADKMRLTNQEKIMLLWPHNEYWLRTVMRLNKPIKDYYTRWGSQLNLDNTGWVKYERDVLWYAGWNYRNGFWYPPKN